MVLILSQSKLEHSTDAVMDWLAHLGVPCRRLNGEDVDGGGGLSVALDRHGDAVAYPPDCDVDPRDVTAVWARRWGYHKRYETAPLLRDGAPGREAFRLEAAHQVKRELGKLSDFVFASLGHARWLGADALRLPNKLLELRAAAACGLDVPATLVTDSREALEAFADAHGGVITKAIAEAGFFFFDDGAYASYTVALSPAEVRQQPARFFPSLFQEHLPKAYELRVFVLDGACYPMVIFSQREGRTATDFRRYDFECPTRTAPYRLPDAVRGALLRYMDERGYDTGSVDLVRTQDGRYVFLEINLAGQFGMVSQPCNYRLERRVAEALARRTHASPHDDA